MVAVGNSETDKLDLESAKHIIDPELYPAPAGDTNGALGWRTRLALASHDQTLNFLDQELCRTLATAESPETIDVGTLTYVERLTSAHTLDGAPIKAVFKEEKPLREFVSHAQRIIDEKSAALFGKNGKAA